ncbi:MAG: phosphate ABC transporter substrate-binding protein [Fimbriimonadales bacterium]|nr:phosphate ABC transporter substrate-binding protein [Fimbriimonadales bacterium]MDW8051237.1 phosphate ABC transporter substrate-binding protein [Armatimonadota bacterium]
MKRIRLIGVLAGVAAFAGLTAFSWLGQQSITIKGSDTMLILNQRWAEAYGRVNPRVSVSVTGGGSSIGINALINGVTDICASSRPMRKSEYDRARSRGVVPHEIPVALDGLAVVVHESNPVDSLTMDQVRRIYIGQITNWSQVGGPNMPIVVFSRDSNSGTYGFFQQVVLKNQNWGPGVRFMPSTSEEAREVARTPGGIAYGGIAYFKNRPGIKILKIAAKEGDTPYAPTEENVRTRKYPISRYLYFYTNGKPKGEVAKFINWVLSPEGQAIVREVGYYPLEKR